jgi:hypothetical protein
VPGNIENVLGVLGKVCRRRGGRSGEIHGICTEGVLGRSKLWSCPALLLRGIIGGHSRVKFWGWAALLMPMARDGGPAKALNHKNHRQDSLVGAGRQHFGLRHD